VHFGLHEEVHGRATTGRLSLCAYGRPGHDERQKGDGGGYKRRYGLRGVIPGHSVFSRQPLRWGAQQAAPFALTGTIARGVALLSPANVAWRHNPMALIETVTANLATAIVKALVKLWLKDHEFAVAGAGSLVDTIKKHITDNRFCTNGAAACRRNMHCTAMPVAG
jgi:hypothetical protein